VLIAGGSDACDWHGTMNRAEIYDPHTGVFTATSPLNDSRFNLPDEAVPLHNGKLLIAGGSKEVEVFDPVRPKFFVAAGPMNDARHFISETRPKDGRRATGRRISEQRPGYCSSLDLPAIGDRDCGTGGGE
jgi:hypothetical protein